MDWFWNWGGECFGYRDGESLFTYFGKEIGRFDGEEVYGSNDRAYFPRIGFRNHSRIRNRPLPSRSSVCRLS
jgi:hypothetical protein